ncbi:MFS transporter [Thermus oshimai]
MASAHLVFQLVLGQFLLGFLTQALILASLWHLLERGASGSLAAGITAVQAVAVLSGSPLFAWILDRRPPLLRPILPLGLVGAALSGLASPFPGLWGSYALLALLVFLLAALLALYGAFTGKALVRLVPKEDLPRANARLEAAGALAGLLGPTLGGTLVGALGSGGVLALLGGALLLPAGLLWRLLPRLPLPDPTPLEGRASALGVPLGLFLLLVAPPALMGVALAMGGLLVGLLLHQGDRPEGLGLAWTVFGLGSLLGARLMTSRPPARLSLGVAVGLGVSGLGNLLTGLLPYPGLLLGSFLAGLGLPVVGATSRTLAQWTGEEDRLGALFAYRTAAVHGTRILGAPLGGFGADALGPGTALLVLGALLASAGAFLLPPLLRLEKGRREGL